VADNRHVMSADPDPSTQGSSSDDIVTEDGDSLGATVVHNEETPDRRTIYPADADDDTLLTHWLTANDESFVDLRDLR
jgi:hypothetical protein